MTTGIDKTIRKLRSAIAKLPATADRPRARRNARARVLAQLRKVRAQLDETYPAIIKRGKVQRLKTPEGRVARLERQGWQWVSSSAAGAYAAAGVPVRRVAKARPPSAFSGAAGPMLFVPEWAVAIGLDHPSDLRAAKGSAKMRRARIAAAALVRDASATP